MWGFLHEILQFRLQGKTVSETILLCWIPGADCAIMALRNLQEDKR